MKGVGGDSLREEMENSQGAQSIQACNPETNLCLKMQFVAGKENAAASGHVYGWDGSGTCELRALPVVESVYCRLHVGKVVYSYCLNSSRCSPQSHSDSLLFLIVNVFSL